MFKSASLCSDISADIFLHSAANSLNCFASRIRLLRSQNAEANGYTALCAGHLLTLGEGKVTEPVAFYRMYAADCAAMAAEVSDTGRRARLLEMAQAWLRLAERVESAPHVTQQQQQPQFGNDPLEIAFPNKTST